MSETHSDFWLNYAVLLLLWVYPTLFQRHVRSLLLLWIAWCRMRHTMHLHAVNQGLVEAVTISILGVNALLSHSGREKKNVCGFQVFWFKWRKLYLFLNENNNFVVCPSNYLFSCKMITTLFGVRNLSLYFC